MLPPLTDNPVTKLDNDEYGFRPYVENLHSLVSSAEPLPITIGIFGQWGTGKSSFMRMWYDLLAFAPETQRIWFNPWRYDQKTEVWAALIQSMLSEVHDETTKPKAVRLARSITWLLMKGTLSGLGSLASGGIVERATIEGALDMLATQDSEAYAALNDFESAFRELVNRYVGEHGRLFVFIDDLDRCTPDAAISVLDAMKLLLGVSRCVFILAMDYDLVSAVTRSKFRIEGGLGSSEYLEKIIQIPFFLPIVQFDTLRDSLRHSVGALGDSPAFWDLVEVGLGPNPRKVKRFVNVLNLATAILERSVRWPDGLALTERMQLAELLIIRSEHRTFFRYLINDPGAWQRLERSPALVMTDDGTFTTDLERETDPELQAFLQDGALARLMSTRPGSVHEHPGAAPSNSIRQMLTTIRALTPEISADPFRG